MQENAPVTPSSKTAHAKQLSIPLHYAQMFVVGFVMLLIGVTGGYFIGLNRNSLPLPGVASASIDRSVPEGKNVDFTLFWQIWDTLEKSYFDKGKLDPSVMVTGAVKGMVASLGDPYTIFLTASENKVTEEDLSGNFEGIGIQIGYRGTQLAVISPLPNSPAEQVGVEAGDYILGIKDPSRDVEVSTSGMTLPTAVQTIRGDAGTEVILTLLREGNDQPFEKAIKRQSIDVPSVVLDYVGANENVAHLKVLKFGAETRNEWEKSVLDILAKKDLDGIVLDLRNNPGGYMQAAIELGAEFMDKGKTVVIEDHGDGNRKEYSTDRFGRLTKEKVVILVNGGSASASEILSGALRDQVGYEIMGTKSFGKGTIQEPLQLEGGEGLHITIAKWLTPKGTWVHENGLEPDIEVQQNQETLEDEQLDAAIDYLLN